jgi:hypothetical protein
MPQPKRSPSPHGQVELVFSAEHPLRHLDDPLTKDISAVARVGESLFLACDELAGLEQLGRTGNGSFGDHRHIPLDAFFELPGGPVEEMDIEGLSAADGWLWILGSHALKRRKPRADTGAQGGDGALARLESIRHGRNRAFLGRLPLETGADGVPGPVARSADGQRRAACLRMNGGPASGLRRWLRRDPHLAPFLGVPSKENGLDVEGIAARGARLWLGLRGPVLGGAHAVVLDLEVKEAKPGRLKPRRIGEEGLRYRKYLLDTGGLGVRDLRLDGEDLLLLVGPTMALDGVARILRWRGAAAPGAAVSGVVDPGRVEVLAELPHRREADHPEGLELWPEAGEGAVLVVHDAPGPQRLDRDHLRLMADVIRVRS